MLPTVVLKEMVRSLHAILEFDTNKIREYNSLEDVCGGEKFHVGHEAMWRGYNKAYLKLAPKN